MSDHHVLYRFYDIDGVLLYIGITMNAPARFGQHRDDKPWWGDVARIEMEQHPSRQAVLDAERAAIVAERPRHNVRHNGAAPRDSVAPAVRRDWMIAVGDFVALGMSSGSCPVGEVIGASEEWVTLRLKDWLTGYYCGRRKSVRMSDVVEIAYAMPSPHLIDDECLKEFQSSWPERYMKAWVAAQVAAAPPLTPEQRGRIAVMLRDRVGA